jgi:hypothetical protein
LVKAERKKMTPTWAHEEEKGDGVQYGGCQLEQYAEGSGRPAMARPGLGKHRLGGTRAGKEGGSHRVGPTWKRER